ncbi:DUF6415 family natural product biosynthesis protein [Streptomyces sp. I05A-00742]|uniref:DUF6415 family natural product biosynthesis protein n=1 Tax=Streptomyces sp. I05A-00742 TaxID=2732853 RepID=UPI00148A03F9|nr:DUF6415 family natural product biosynthesis protein [Streptomyces sp. I05A-00742]
MTLMTGDVEPLDLVTIRATVRRALQVRARPPRAAEVREITVTLRKHVRRMLRVARSRAEEVEQGTMAWIQWTALIHRVEDDLDRVAEPGRTAAAMYMDDLGRTCRRLADCLDE